MTEKHPDIGNNWVAACVAMWSNTMSKEEFMELMVRKFDIRLMEEISKRINRPSPHSVPQPHIGGVRHQEQEGQHPDTACMGHGHDCISDMRLYPV